MEWGLIACGRCEEGGAREGLRPVGLMGVGGKEQRSSGHGVVDASRNESPIFRHLG